MTKPQSHLSGLTMRCTCIRMHLNTLRSSFAFSKSKSPFVQMEQLIQEQYSMQQNLAPLHEGVIIKQSGIQLQTRYQRRNYRPQRNNDQPDKQSSGTFMSSMGRFVPFLTISTFQNLFKDICTCVDRASVQIKISKTLLAKCDFLTQRMSRSNQVVGQLRAVGKWLQSE